MTNIPDVYVLINSADVYMESKFGEINVATPKADDFLPSEEALLNSAKKRYGS